MGKEKGKGMKASVALAAMIVVMAAAFVPVATAIYVTITPDTNVAGATTRYTVEAGRNYGDPGYNDWVHINVTLPAGYEAVVPTKGGETIATANLYENGVPYAKVTFTSNNSDPAGLMDVMVSDGSGPISTTIRVDYTPGGITSVHMTYHGWNIDGEARLPKATTKGYMDANLTIPSGITLTDILIDIPYVRNPSEPAEYPFEVLVEDSTGIVIEPDEVTIVPPAALPVLTPIGLLALVGILSIVLVGATMRRKAR